MTDNKPYSSSVVSGNNAVRVFKRNGLTIPVAPLKEYVTLKTPYLHANQFYDIPLEQYINYPIKIDSILMDLESDAGANNDFSPTRLVIVFKETGTEIGHYEIVFKNSFMNTPPVILLPSYEVSIVSVADVNSLFIVASQVEIVESITLP